MDFVIITGMSGAGKTSALHVLEDIGYYSVDNIPASLLPMLYTLCSKSDDPQMHRVAVVVDVRGTENYKMMFFDAKNDAIIVRYKETRRRHPLVDRIKDGLVSEAVELERALVASTKNHADFLIDTTYMSNKQLRERVLSLFLEDTTQALTLSFMSFGFKYGIPLEADMIIDVRCLPNPFYIPDLKHQTGLDQPVRDYVLGSEETQQFLKHTLNLLDYAVPLYLKEGKSELVVGVGCTGGKHRSVTLARELESHFHRLGYKCVIQHRDVQR